MILYQALTRQSSIPSSVDYVVLGLQLLCTEFRKVSFSHVCHQSNRPAHLLAKHAKDIVDFFTWMKKNPYFLDQALLHDVISSVMD